MKTKKEIEKEEKSKKKRKSLKGIAKKIKKSAKRVLGGKKYREAQKEKERKKEEERLTKAVNEIIQIWKDLYEEQTAILKNNGIKPKSDIWKEYKQCYFLGEKSLDKPQKVKKKEAFASEEAKANGVIKKIQAAKNKKEVRNIFEEFKSNEPDERFDALATVCSFEIKKTNQDDDFLESKEILSQIKRFLKQVEKKVDKDVLRVLKRVEKKADKKALTKKDLKKVMKGKKITQEGLNEISEQLYDDLFKMCNTPILRGLWNYTFASKNLSISDMEIHDIKTLNEVKEKLLKLEKKVELKDVILSDPLNETKLAKADFEEIKKYYAQVFVQRPTRMRMLYEVFHKNLIDIAEDEKDIFKTIRNQSKKSSKIKELEGKFAELGFKKYLR